MEGLYKQLDQDEYRSDSGYVMKREYGLSPNGNNFYGRWVLRNQNDEFVDYDQYRIDLAARNDFWVGD